MNPDAPKKPFGPTSPMCPACAQGMLATAMLPSGEFVYANISLVPASVAIQRQVILGGAVFACRIWICGRCSYTMLFYDRDLTHAGPPPGRNIAVTIDGGETLCLTSDEARQLARALDHAAQDLDTRSNG